MAGSLCHPGRGSSLVWGGGYIDTHLRSRREPSRSQRDGSRDSGFGDSGVGDGVSGDGGGLAGPLAVAGGWSPALVQLLPSASEST